MVHRLVASFSLLVVLIASAATARSQDPNSPATWLHDALHSANRPRPTIVLVHGASTGASGWRYVIPILRKDGYRVIAVENPLSSLAADIATTRSVIRAQEGPVVVVGHAYGGAVITGAAAGSLNVKALVYLAAFAPDANEPISAFNKKNPSASGAALPANTAILNETISFPAWRSIPSWYLVSREDRAISPNLERFFAKRMRATTIEIKATHLAIISQPKIVARFIEDAATASRK